MSYDYNAIVSSITYHRHEFSNLIKVGESSTALEQCQSSVDLFTDLSTKCPMTPLLWMQYAYDAGFVVEELMRRSSQLEEEDGEGGGTKKAGGEEEEEEEREIQKRGADTRKDVLELALEEFPGCAALRLRYLEEVCLLATVSSSSSNDKDDNKEEEEEKNEDAMTDENIRQDFENALSYVGCGSHQNDDVYVSRIYRLYIWYLTNFYTSSKDILCRRDNNKDLTQERRKEIMNVFIQRANTPMKSENDSLSNELNEYLQGHNVKADEANDVIGQVEQGRMCASKLFDSYATLEDEIDVAMGRDGIVLPDDGNLFLDRENEIDEEKGSYSRISWDTLLNEQKKEGDNNGGGKTTTTYLMGLGAMSTSAAFLDYVKAINRDIYEDDPNNKKNKKRKRNIKNEEENEEDEEQKERKQMREALILSVFERAISECPTVESVWVAYIRHILRLIKTATTAAINEGGKNVVDAFSLQTYLRRLESISNRSVRNCPYSTTLFDLKMRCIDIIAEHDVSVVFDADKILDVVKKEAIEGKFLPDKESYLKVYLSAIGVIKQRILAKVSSNSSKRYDDADGVETRKAAKKKQHAGDNGVDSPLDAETEQEVLDIIDDLREIYDEADSYLRKSYGKWTEGRAVLWKDRADAEAYVLSPLVHSLGDGDDDDPKEKTTDEVERCYEKLVRVHHPSHPDSWLAYIRYITGKKSLIPSSSHEQMKETPGSTIAILRKTRGLFRRAMQSVKKQSFARQNEDGRESGGSDWDGNRNYELALHCLCHDYLEFERAFGSEESHNLASKLVKAKIGTLDERNLIGATAAMAEDGLGGVNVPATVEEGAGDTATTGKRKHLDDEGETGRDHSEVEPAAKRLKTSTDDASAATEDNAGSESGTKNEVIAEKRTNLKEPKIRPEHTVHVGTLDYPAHPFTIRVTNLSPDTEDMDLVDAFRYKCGAIVHAKILRDKHHPRNAKGKSKCEGLVQFEERESVEKALQLNEEIGLHEKLIHVGRSHIPAVGIVPPGMHRVNPKGEGRSTKHNLKRKEKMAKVGKSSDKDNGDSDRADAKVKSTVDGAKAPDKQKDTNNEKGENEGSDAKKISPYITPESNRNKQTKKGKTQASDILAFRPRGLHGQRHHKVKVSLKDTHKNKK